MKILFFIISFMILIVSELYYIHRAKIHNWTSAKNQRTDGHPVAVVGGGFIFYLAIVLWSLGAGWIYDPSEAMSALMVGSTMLAACSFADDILQLKIWIRLVVQFIAIAFLCFQLPSIDIGIGIWIFYVIAAVGFVNAYNFMDGINGITGLYSLAVLCPILWYNLNIHHFISGTLILFAIMAIAIFCFFNCRRRAIIFAGDVGSITMGYIVTALLSFMIFTTNDITIIILVIVYGVDTTMTIIRRIIERENIFQSHNKHAYQILNRIFRVPQMLISSCYAAIQAAISIGYLSIPKSMHWPYITVVTALLITIWQIITLAGSKKKNL